MMEICQSCLTSFEDDATKDVRFTIWEEVNRQWYLCPSCAAKLQDLVLGFMGEARSTTEELCPEPPDWPPPPEPLGPSVWIATSVSGARHYSLDEGKHWTGMRVEDAGDCIDIVKDMVGRKACKTERPPTLAEANNTVPHKFQVAKCPAYVPGECEERISHLEGVSKLHCKPQDISYGGCNSWLETKQEEPETAVGPALGTVHTITINGHKANVLIVEYPESEIDKIS